MVCSDIRGTVVTCNGCNAAIPEGYGLRSSVEGGYGSVALNDFTRYTFALCEACLRKLFNTMLTPPVVVDLSRGETLTTYAEDVETMRRTIWHNSPVRANKVQHGLCNHDDTCTSRHTGRSVYVGDRYVNITDNYLCTQHAPADAFHVPLNVFVDDPLERLERWMRFKADSRSGRVIRNDFVNPLFWTEEGDSIPGSPFLTHGNNVAFQWVPEGSVLEGLVPLFERKTPTGTLYAGISL